MLRLLAGIPMQKTSGVYPLVDFVVSVYKYNYDVDNENKAALRKLDTTYQEIRQVLNLQQRDETHLIKHNNKHLPLDHRYNIYLMVELKPQERDTNRFSVRAWIMSEPIDPNTGIMPIHLDTQTDQIVCTLANFGTVLTQLIVQALGAIDSEQADLSIELFAPHTAFNYDFEELEIQDGFDLPVKLVREYPLVMRQQERLEPKHKKLYLKKWRKRWDMLQAQIVQEKPPEAANNQNDIEPANVLNWVTDHQHTDEQLYNLMNVEDKVLSVAFAIQRPPAGSNPACSIFKAALRAAVPAVIWYRCDQPIDPQVYADLEALIAYNESIPKQLLKLRREAADPTNQELKPIGRSITLLWENPHRLPIIDDSFRAPTVDVPSSHNV
jgi:hypothetical protein